MLFEEYGDRVKYWLTINEQDHVIRIPKRMGLTGKEPDYDRLRYQANHNMCVASARAFKLCHEMLPGAMIGPALFPLQCSSVIYDGAALQREIPHSFKEISERP